jgi:dodecin
MSRKAGDRRLWLRNHYSETQSVCNCKPLAPYQSFAVLTGFFVYSVKIIHMPILKVIEVLANSPNSWEEATQAAVTHASKSIRHIKSVNVNNMSALVDDAGKITEYRVNVKISFEVE